VLQGAKRRWAALSAKAQRNGRDATPSARGAAAAVPAAQLTRIRAALAELGALTASACQGLASMEAWLDDNEPMSCV
jgi:hypothetical protein